MDEALQARWRMAQQDQRLSEVVNREYARLRNFIRKRVEDQGDAEDLVQEVFYELVEAYRLMKPIEQVTAWLFQVARNRIADLFRSRQREAPRRGTSTGADEDGAEGQLVDLLPSPDAGPEASYLRGALLEELDAALDELPPAQREVFVGHELMGFSFNEISKQTGVSVNTLLSRKHYAVMQLRKRLQSVYEELRKR